MAILGFCHLGSPTRLQVLFSIVGFCQWGHECRTLQSQYLHLLHLHRFGACYYELVANIIAHFAQCVFPHPPEMKSREMQEISNKEK